MGSGDERTDTIGRMNVPIRILTTRAHADEARSLVERGGAPARGLYEVLPYESLGRQVPGGHYVFADLERLDDRTRRVAVVVRRALLAQDRGWRMLNHPSASLSRAELLRALAAEGINRFRATRVWERVDRRYPVFLRHEAEHTGAMGEPVADPAALDAEVRRLVEAGFSRERLLAVEFEDVRSPDGLYRKYSAMRVGDALFPVNVQFSRGWVTKQTEVVTEDTVSEELALARDFPGQETVQRVFEIAAIEYGRIDYALVDGRPCVWEINTNPTLIGETGGHPLRAPVRARFVERAAAAFRALGAG